AASQPATVASQPAATPVVNVRLFAGVAPILNGQWNNWDIGNGTPPAPKSSGIFDYSNGTTSPVSAVLTTQTSIADNGATYLAGVTAVCPDSVLRFTSY